MDTVLHPIDVSDARADGLSWSLQLPPGVPRGADQTDFFGSPLRLFEDGRELGPGTALHTEIRDLGGGRFHHWLRTLYFSTPDGSDPRTNGRVYALAGAPMRVETGPWARRAAHEMNIAESFLVRFATLGVDVAGKDLLELGPGATLGASLLLACAGARVTVADRFPARFRPDTIPLYQLLERDWHMDTAPIAAVLAEGGFSAALRSVPEAAESLDSVADASMDVVISNAVLEHVRDIGQAARELRRVSRPGAWHFHQIDFRDHRDSSRPLEHLLLDEASFRADQDSCRWERGCQWRISEVRDAFAAAGFAIETVEINQRAPADYLADFLPRLRRAGASRYADWPQDDLAVLGGLLLLRA